MIHTIVRIVFARIICVQMIRAMHDSRRRIGRFAQDDSRKNGDDSRTELVMFGAFIVLSTQLESSITAVLRPSLN